jgi:hypothetical protein
VSERAPRARSVVSLRNFSAAARRVERWSSFSDITAQRRNLFSYFHTSVATFLMHVRKLRDYIMCGTALFLLREFADFSGSGFVGDA